MPVVKIAVYGSGRVKTVKAKSPSVAKEKAADFDTDEMAIEHAASHMDATHYAKTNYGIFALSPRKDGGYDAYLVYYEQGKWHLQRIPTAISALPPDAQKIDTKASSGAKETIAGFSSIERDPKDVEEGRALGQVRGAKDVYRILHKPLSKESQELFIVVPLDIYSYPCSKPIEVARGQRDQVAINVSDVLSAVADKKASAFIVVHNHPSTEASPSDADKQLTKQIKEAALVAIPDVPFLDHVIIGASSKGGEYYSFQDAKLYKVGSRRKK